MPTDEQLGELRNLAMLISDPRPDHHIGGILLMTVWELNEDPTDATSDFFVSPPDLGPQMIRNIGLMAKEMGLI